MLSKFTFSILLSVLAVAASAQSFQIVTETERLMSFGSRPAFRVEFPTTSVSQVEDQWKDFAKRSFDAKLKKERKTGEWVALETRPTMLGGENFAIYSTVEKLDREGAALTVWFDAGTRFLNRRENPGQAEEVNKALRQFYYDVRRETLGKELKKQEDMLKDLENKQKKLQRENENLRKDIENYKQRIVKAEEEVVKNEKDQEATVVDIDKQRRAVEEARRRRDNVQNEGN